MPAGAYPARVDLPSLPPRRFLLRRLDGTTEAMVAPEQPGIATRLLERLLGNEDGEPVDLATLPLAVHDRLLALVYATEFGETVSCRATCAACAERFEFRFPLSALLASQDKEAAIVGQPGEDGCWEGPSGTRIRPPTLADAQAADGNDLLARIVSPAPPPNAASIVGAFLERASPLLSLDVDTACPECGAAQAIWLDLGRFLAQSIAGERPFLIREAHLIAARYGWSHGEIMALPREDRRAFATLIESERSASLRRAS